MDSDERFYCRINEQDALQVAHSHVHGCTSSSSRSRSRSRTSRLGRTNGYQKGSEDGDEEEEVEAKGEEEEEGEEVIVFEDEESGEKRSRRAGLDFIKELRKDEAKAFWEQECEWGAPFFEGFLEIRRNGQFVLHTYCTGLHAWFHCLDRVWYPQDS